MRYIYQKIGTQQTKVTSEKLDKKTWENKGVMPKRNVKGAKKVKKSKKSNK